MSKKFKQRAIYRDINIRYNYWLTRLLKLASSSIRWKGLPEYVDTILLENCLTRSGSAIIVYDRDMDRYFAGQNASTGMLDIYGYPENRSIIFANGMQAWYDKDTSVIIYNNSLRCSDLWVYQSIASIMADMDLAIMININSQKTMPIIPASQNTKLTLENLYNNILDNMPYCFVDSQSVDIMAFKESIQFDNRKSFTADNIVVVQREFWNRALTYIGINNVNVEKRERVNTAETNSNMDEIAVMRRDRINAREYAGKLMKQIGLDNVTADYYSNLVPAERGDGNGYVHNAGKNNL